MVYDSGLSKHKCYFVEFVEKATCATTGLIRVKGETYSSLYDYYQREKPNINVAESDNVAKVSFPKLANPQYVAAKLLRLRVMNDALPKSLKQVDKIPPFERGELIREFWDKLFAKELFKRIDVANHFWLPNKGQIVEVKLPTLRFAQNRKIKPPLTRTIQSYREYYQKRLELLDEVGCLYIPPTIHRVINLAIPNKASEPMKERFTKDIINKITKWTKRNFTCEVLPYSNFQEAINILQSKNRSGLVVFIFDDDDPAVYSYIAYELKSWRVKKIKYVTLEKQYKKVTNAEGNSKKEGSKKFSKAIKRWNSFIEMNALDILQLLDCIPWAIDTQLNYEAQLAIDVGADHRYFALSLMIIQNANEKLPMYIDTIVCQKFDTKKETINEVILRDEIIRLFRRIPMGKVNPISSLLILRDGHECGNEIDGIEEAKAEIVSLGIIRQNARVDIVDYHKRTLKDIRFWDRISTYKAINALEATAIKLNDKTFVLQNTGAATIPRYKTNDKSPQTSDSFNERDEYKQGTAEPLMLVARTKNADMLKVVEDVAAGAQLNFSNPNVAQRLTLPLKRTDDELENRASQEVRRIK